MMMINDVFWFRDAFHYVQRKRFCINPNEGFTRQLMVCVSTALARSSDNAKNENDADCGDCADDDISVTILWIICSVIAF